MNKKYKSGLYFGIFMSIYFVAMNLLTEDNSTTRKVVFSIVWGLASGIISGLLFGWSVNRFLKSKLVKESTRIGTTPGETIIFDSPANHFKGVEGVGGKLYLTNKRLVFKSHKLNVQNHELSLNLGDIAHTERYKPIGIINNGLIVTTVNGQREKFVVDHPVTWVKHLTETGITQTPSNPE